MKCPLVIIHWQDSSQPLPAWKHLSDLPEFVATECASVGWLLRSDKRIKVLAQSLGGMEKPDGSNAQGMGIMTIPASCVVSLEHLGEKKKRKGKRK